MKIDNKKSLISTSAAYFELCKPNVMYLAILSAATGIILVPNVSISWYMFLFLMFLISIGAGSAGAFNMSLEKDIDMQMARTRKRPLPSSRVSKSGGLTFAFLMASISVILLWVCFNWLCAAGMLFTIVFYAYFYTLVLKKNTVYNIVIGGIPGAMPPLIGWSALTGNISFGIFSFFLIIFFWIPPHSWALALFKVKEYAKVSIPMMPVVKGRAYTIKQMILFTVPMVISSYLPYLTHLCSLFYTFIISGLNIIFCYILYKLYKDTNDLQKNKYEKMLFFYSINYLFIILIVAIIDQYVY